MFIYLFIYLFIHLFIYLSIYLFIYLFIYWFIYSFIYLFINYVFSLLLYWRWVSWHISRVICYFYRLLYYYYFYWYYYYCYYYNYCYYYCYLYFNVISVYYSTEPLLVFAHVLLLLSLSLGFYHFNWFVTIWVLFFFF